MVFWPLSKLIKISEMNIFVRITAKYALPPTLTNFTHLLPIAYNYNIE